MTPLSLNSANQKFTMQYERMSCELRFARVGKAVQEVQRQSQARTAVAWCHGSACQGARRNTFLPSLHNTSALAETATTSTTQWAAAVNPTMLRRRTSRRCSIPEEFHTP